MGKVLQVECKHLEGELMRVRFAGSQLVSDHPFRMGGTETGPSPGEMMMMGLASASALAGRQFASRIGLPVGHVGARASMAMHSEGFGGDMADGPLSRRTYVGQFWRRLEADAATFGDDLEPLLAAMSDTTVAATLRQGAEIDERLVHVPLADGRDRLAEKNPFHLSGDPAKRMAEGESAPSFTPDNWRVAAAALDDDTCLLRAVRSLWVVGSSVEALKGPTPEELLLAALAACTTIYVARNSSLREIPVQSVQVTVRAELPDNPGDPIVRFDKTCTVTGDLTGEEVAATERMAYYCALGETIKRGAPFRDEMAFNHAPGAAQAGNPLQALTGNAPKPSDPAYCDDGSCCVPG